MVAPRDAITVHRLSIGYFRNGPCARFLLSHIIR